MGKPYWQYEADALAVARRARSKSGNELSKRPCKGCGNPSHFLWYGCPVCRMMKAIRKQGLSNSHDRYPPTTKAQLEWETKVLAAETTLAAVEESHGL